MATVKVTVTLDASHVKKIRALVSAGATPSVSAFVKHSVRTSLLDAEEWRACIDEALQATGGPLTKKERAWARSVLSGKAGKVVRKNKAKAA